MTIYEFRGRSRRNHPSQFRHSDRNGGGCYDGAEVSDAENETPAATDSGEVMESRVISYGELTVSDRPRQAKMTLVHGEGDTE